LIIVLTQGSTLVSLSSFGNLAAAGVTDGTELLKALSSTNVAATSITATTGAGGDKVFFVAYQAGNAYIYHAKNAASAGLITASEISLVGVVNDITQGCFASGDFVNLG
jgi:hypothetical protein